MSSCPARHLSESKGIPLRIITVEEHFQHPEAVARVLELSDPPSVTPDAGFASFLRDFAPDKESTERLAGKRLAHMDEVGIDTQVVSHGANSPSGLDHPDAVELCRKVNDALAEQISQHPTRFRGFATIPLHDPAAAADEMRRCVNELGFVGTLVTGTCGGLFLDDERFDPVLAAAEDVDLPIYVHPGVPPNPVSRAYYAGNWPTAIEFLFSSPGFGWHAEAGIHVLRIILSGALDRPSRPQAAQRSLGRTGRRLARATRRDNRLGRPSGSSRQRVLPRACVDNAVGSVQPESAEVLSR